MKQKSTAAAVAVVVVYCYCWWGSLTMHLWMLCSSEKHYICCRVCFVTCCQWILARHSSVACHWRRLQVLPSRLPMSRLLRTVSAPTIIRGKLLSTFSVGLLSHHCHCHMSVTILSISSFNILWRLMNSTWWLTGWQKGRRLVVLFQHSLSLLEL